MVWFMCLKGRMMQRLLKLNRLLLKPLALRQRSLNL
jgi:hypothetical protein